jgi:hypothetical protein
MINLSRLSSLALEGGLGIGRLPHRFFESHTRLLHHAPDSVLAAPVDGQIAISTEAQLPARAQVVIAGSGMIGNSVAFHLTQVWHQPAIF